MVKRAIPYFTNCSDPYILVVHEIMKLETETVPENKIKCLHQASNQILKVVDENYNHVEGKQLVMYDFCTKLMK